MKLQLKKQHIRRMNFKNYKNLAINQSSRQCHDKKDKG